MKIDDSRILYDYALGLVGLPYFWGGSNALTGFDCSGLVIELYQSIGLLPHKSDYTSLGLYKKYIKESKDADWPKFGALCFYGQTVKQITHVALALNNHLVIEAAGGNASTTSLLNAKQNGAVVRLRPYNYRQDLVAILRPKYFDNLE